MSLEINRVRALCFDVDGTLSDSDDVHVRQFTRILERFHFRQPARTARRLVMWLEAPANGLLTLADSLGIDDEMFAVLNWMVRHRSAPRRRFLLVPGVEDMLSRLYSHYPMSVVSSRDEHTTLAFLDHFNLTRFFDVIVTGLSTKRTKPYPDPVQWAARKMLMAPDECLMIGDTTVDIRAGRSAGAQTVGVLCGYGEEFELRRMGADLILESTALVADALLYGLKQMPSPQPPMPPSAS